MYALCFEMMLFPKQSPKKLSQEISSPLKMVWIKFQDGEYGPALEESQCQFLKWTS